MQVGLLTKKKTAVKLCVGRQQKTGNDTAASGRKGAV